MADRSLHNVREKLRTIRVRRGLDLSASGFVALLASNMAESALPATLRLTTLRAAARFAAGEPATQVASATVAQLVEGGLRTMMIGKLKLGVIVVAAALLTTGAGLTAFQALATLQPPAQQDENRAATVRERPATGTEEPKPTRNLTVRVVDGKGKPVADAEVYFLVGYQDVTAEGKTNAEGRYELKVYSEFAYIVAVQDKTWAAPYKSGIVVRIGKPIRNVDFVLGKATRLHGRITVGKDNRPASGLYLSLVIDIGKIPPELQSPNDRTYHAIRMYFHATADKDGRYEFFLGPGEYQLESYHRLRSVKITIPAGDPPAEIVRDVRMSRPEMGRFTGRVVDTEGRPVAGAIVDGTYAASAGSFPPVKTDVKGRFTVERFLDPLVLRAQSADEGRAGIVRIDAEAEEAKIVIGPVAKATGRLLDLQGKPLAGKELPYGIRVYLGEGKMSGWTNSFGGKASTDSDGHFTLIGLVPGEKYFIDIPLSETSWREVKQVLVNSDRALDLGDLRVDPTPRRPYVPPTPEK